MRIKLLFAVGAVIVAARALKHLAKEKMIPGGHSSLGRALLSKSTIFRTPIRTVATSCTDVIEEYLLSGEYTDASGKGRITLNLA